MWGRPAVPQMRATTKERASKREYGLPGCRYAGLKDDTGEVPSATSGGMEPTSVSRVPYPIPPPQARRATMTQIIQFWVLWSAIFLVALLAWGGGMGYGTLLTEVGSMPPEVAEGTSPVSSLSPAYLHPGNQYSLFEALSLVVALICGTAGLPHILVRFYTNPDRSRARWSVVLVLALIGAFYIMAPYIGLTMRYLFVSTSAGSAGGVEGLSSQVMGWLAFDGQNLAIPAAAMRFGGQLVLGLVVAGALAAVLSTTAGLLVVM